jgi:hypothetical protein
VENPERHKRTEIKLIITQADKGKTVVIIHEHEYNSIINNFIQTNQFTHITQNSLNTCQNNIKEAIKQCPEHNPKNTHWKYYNMNLQAPNLHAEIKLHKTPLSVRSIVNWSNSPAYKLAAYLIKILKQNIQLPNTYNIKNTPHLIADLQNLHIDKNTRMCSFDISNMYTNIAANRVTTIINTTLNNQNLQPNTIKEIGKITHSVLSQNFYKFSNDYCNKKEA